MVNVLTMYMPLLRGLLKLVGVRPQAVEIEPGTVLRFWIPSDDQTTSNANKKPNKPAVVFVHGFELDGILTWQFQVLALAREYAVYVPDLLFFGESFTDRTERKVVFQAECVAKGLKKLGVEKCTLVGMSYGGMVCFKMAEMYPDLVESMVVSCTAMVMTESISRASLKRIGFSSWPEYLMPDTVMGVKELLRNATYKLPWLPDFVHRSILEASNLFYLHVMFGNRKERLELLDELVVSDKDFTVPHFTQKIHLLWGRDDIIFNLEEARNLKDQLEGKATLHLIENAGHLAQSERPFAYNKHLKNILASLHDDGKRKQQLVGVRSQAVEIEPGTVVHFWAPAENPSKTRIGRKPAVVFLHGFGFNGISTWHFQMLALAKDYAIYVPDFLFFGGSATDRTERSPAFQAECMAKGLKKLGVERCTLVGLSYGGMVGFRMAEMYPELVDSMVVTCSVMALTESITRSALERIGFSSWAELFVPETFKGVKTIAEICTFKSLALPDFLYRDIFQDMFINYKKERVELLEALIVKDKDFYIPNFPQAQRIHLLWGEEDVIFTWEIACNLKEKLLEGKATLHSLEKAGHAVQLERPCAYNRQLKKILASLHAN
ncbi:hypothetical protein SADUNF_Sadunf09G0095100 [Salix dunnii]|uniref:AB hydrolase-1 domain-containing protein n=1 Tax=Salix dunnii TaxID=1413687 RepID=A0A835JWL4_9ROSI|nr:hypothetical protein SADUNF_Sadunf09G0095100 [Salix dunnii]